MCDNRISTGGTIAKFGAQSAQLDALSTMTDKQATRLNELGHQIDVLQLADTELSTKLVEVETQFRASDQLRNLMHANEMRIESVLWRKAFPEAPLPTDNAYYPTIAK